MAKDPVQSQQDLIATLEKLTTSLEKLRTGGSPGGTSPRGGSRQRRRNTASTLKNLAQTMRASPGAMVNGGTVIQGTPPGSQNAKSLTAMLSGAGQANQVQPSSGTAPQQPPGGTVPAAWLAGQKKGFDALASLLKRPAGAPSPGSPTWTQQMLQKGLPGGKGWSQVIQAPAPPVRASVKAAMQQGGKTRTAQGWSQVIQAAPPVPSAPLPQAPVAKQPTTLRGQLKQAWQILTNQVVQAQAVQPGQAQQAGAPTQAPRPQLAGMASRIPQALQALRGGAGGATGAASGGTAATSAAGGVGRLGSIVGGANLGGNIGGIVAGRLGQTVGTAAGGMLAAGGVSMAAIATITGVVGGIALLGAATIKCVHAMHDFAEDTFAAARDLARFSPQIATAFMKLDRQTMLLQARMAVGTSGSTSALGASVRGMREQLHPFQQDITSVKNMIGTSFARGIQVLTWYANTQSDMVKFARAGITLLERILGSQQPQANALAQMWSDIGAGNWHNPPQPFNQPPGGGP